MKVSEFMAQEQINKDFIESKMDMETDYWKACDKFIRQRWDQDVNRLTEKQRNWLGKIREDCTEKRIGG